MPRAEAKRCGAGQRAGPEPPRCALGARCRTSPLAALAAMTRSRCPGLGAPSAPGARRGQAGARGHRSRRPARWQPPAGRGEARRGKAGAGRAAALPAGRCRPPPAAAGRKTPPRSELRRPAARNRGEGRHACGGHLRGGEPRSCRRSSSRGARLGGRRCVLGNAGCWRSLVRERRTPGFAAVERFLSALGTYAVGAGGERGLAVVLADFSEYVPSIRRALPHVRC